MRRKMEKDEKRSKQIGVKVQIQTRKQLEFIANREATTLSTLIDKILKDYINTYLSIAKINWEQLTPEERGEK